MSASEPALCPCGSTRNSGDCCDPLLDGSAHAATAEALMRMRYTAYALDDIDSLVRSTRPDQQHLLDDAAMRHWNADHRWKHLTVLATTAGDADDNEGWVEFEALFEAGGKHYLLHERSHFDRIDGRWYYDLVPDDAKLASHPQTFLVERNAACPCGSGRKLKKCCALI